MFEHISVFSGVHVHFAQVNVNWEGFGSNS